MRRFLLICAGLLLLLARPALANKVLPSSFGDWSSSGSPAAPSSMPDTETTAFHEYGFAAAEQNSYLHANAAFDVTAYAFQDPSGAYGAYSFLITPDLKRADLTEHSSISPDRALILVGNVVLDIHGKDLPAHQADLKALVTAVEPHAESGPLPTLWQHLPQKNFVARSDHYILGPQTLNQLFPIALGDSLGFSKGAEAELGHYKVNGRDETLVIADFPTPGFAMQQLADLQKQFNVDGSKPDSTSPPLFAKRDYTLLAIVSGAPTQSDAKTILDQVQSGTQLTWDEPTFQFKEPSIEMMIVGSIVGAGFICGFALIAGLAFGGFRLFIKRLLPGRVFDRTEHVQVLQMGLVSKPINAEDFYGSVGTVAGKVTVDKNLPDRIALRIFR
jgi:hypothetical protein